MVLCMNTINSRKSWSGYKNTAQAFNYSSIKGYEWIEEIKLERKSENKIGRDPSSNETCDYIKLDVVYLDTKLSLIEQGILLALCTYI